MARGRSGRQHSFRPPGICVSYAGVLFHGRRGMCCFRDRADSGAADQLVGSWGGDGKRSLATSAFAIFKFKLLADHALRNQSRSQ